jgi:putative hydrolase of the HAD superfamily
MTSHEGRLRSVIIFDADNTLWDTDSIFRSAQKVVLSNLRNAGLILDPETQFELLRSLDRELIGRLGRAEYDFNLLCVALVNYYSHSLSISEAALSATSDCPEIRNPNMKALVKELHVAFEDALQAIPPLYPDTMGVLASIERLKTVGYPMATVLCSEGDTNRLERILAAYDIRRRRFFDEIIIAQKSLETWIRAKDAGTRHLPLAGEFASPLVFVVGDSLQRDIKPANQLGFISVYKPSKYLGQEKPQQPDEQPRHTIDFLSTFLLVLREHGIPATLHSAVPS